MWTICLHLAAAARQARLRLGKPAMSFCYVDILQSIQVPEHFYVGLTEDLQHRLARHNAGEVPHTARLRPWRIKTAVAFTDRARAADFERYLKSPSGRAFSKKRL
jgi:predicted GIY-YIG superfamily endonuclease